MKPVDIIAWTMGWPVPIIIVYGFFMVWGIWRLILWDEHGSEERSSGPTQSEQCVCACDVC